MHTCIHVYLFNPWNSCPSQCAQWCHRHAQATQQVSLETAQFMHHLLEQYMWTMLQFTMLHAMGLSMPGTTATILKTMIRMWECLLVPMSIIIAMISLPCVLKAIISFSWISKKILSHVEVTLIPSEYFQIYNGDKIGACMRRNQNKVLDILAQNAPSSYYVARSKVVQEIVKSMIWHNPLKDPIDNSVLFYISMLI